jgi:hypothetical protein
MVAVPRLCFACLLELRLLIDQHGVSLSPSLETIRNDGGDDGTAYGRAAAREINPILQGWLNYYGRYSPSAMHALWKYVNATLIAWAMRKYKRYNGRKIQAGQMIGSIADKRWKLFVHWHQSTVGAFA